MTSFPERLRFPESVHRQRVGQHPRGRRVCREGRPYTIVPFTIKGDLVVGDYEPAWQVDRDYWVARLSAEVGTHKSGTHPAGDGTPSGSAIQMNLRRITVDGTGDASILTADTRLKIAVDKHKDAMNATEDGEQTESDFAIKKLRQYETVYVSVNQVGSGRPGRAMVVLLTLVPYPWPGRIDL